jgi:pimeloyl-ACP methyl ester carboxylesterase
VIPWVVEGPDDGPAIIFVHGAIVSRDLWRPQVARLRERYRCVTVDLPGHGVLAGRTFTLDGAVGVLHDAIDALDATGDGRVVVVGLSLGGYAAMALAAAHPERVRGLVIAGASAEPLGIWAPAFMAYGWFLTLLPERLGRWAFARLLRRVHGSRVAAEIVAGYQLRAGGRAVRSIRGTSFRDRLLAYGGPVLVINGTLDVVFRLAERRFVRDIPRVSVRRLVGANHVSNVERPDEFSAAIEAFERSLDG